MVGRGTTLKMVDRKKKKDIGRDPIASLYVSKDHYLCSFRAIHPPVTHEGPCTLLRGREQDYFPFSGSSVDHLSFSGLGGLLSSLFYWESGL